jgi:hypothetical protein
MARVIYRDGYWSEDWCLPYTRRQRVVRGIATLLALALMWIAVAVGGFIALGGSL